MEEPGRYPEPVRRRADGVRFQNEQIVKMAGNLAHRLNNIFTEALCHGDIAAEIAATIPPRILRERIAKMIRALEKGAAVADQLLALGMPVGRGVPEPVDINRIIDGSDEILRSAVGGAYVLRFAQGPLPAVKVDAIGLVAVLAALLINAREATPPGGMIQVLTAAVEIGEGRAAELDATVGRHAMVAISDDGAGMSVETLGALDADKWLFTTKHDGRHDGMGLFQAERFALDAGGRLEIVSAIGEGTTVRLFLPAVAEPETQKKGGPEGPPIPSLGINGPREE